MSICKSPFHLTSHLTSSDVYFVYLFVQMVRKGLAYSLLGVISPKYLYAYPFLFQPFSTLIRVFGSHQTLSPKFQLPTIEGVDASVAKGLFDTFDWSKTMDENKAAAQAYIDSQSDETVKVVRY